MNAQPSIPRLVPDPDEAPRGRASITPARLDACVDAFSRGAHDRAMAVLGRLCDSAGPEAACERVLKPVARELGARWEADTCDFATLTLAMGRLHALLHGVGRRWGDVPPPRRARRVLLSAAPGEQHIFGPAMLAEAFRAAGWEVCAPQGASGRDLAARVRTGGFEVVGLSVATDAGLDGLGRLIADLRAARASAPPVVLVGGRPFLERPDLVRMMGADGTAADCAGAVALAGALSDRLQAAA